MSLSTRLPSLNALTPPEGPSNVVHRFDMYVLCVCVLQILYCSRTHSQTSQFINEVRVCGGRGRGEKSRCTAAPKTKIERKEVNDNREIRCDAGGLSWGQGPDFFTSRTDQVTKVTVGPVSIMFGMVPVVCSDNW